MYVTNIQHFCLDDGPGIRTTVFFAGCNMRCLWCHNPENFEKSELMFDRQRCVLCGKCEKLCPNKVHSIKDRGHFIDREKCNGCMLCISRCQTGALRFSSKDLSEYMILQEIQKDMGFYKRSFGGVTFSGGEPVLQGEKLLHLLQLCRESDIHTAIETAGNYSFEMLAPMLEWLDLIIMDLKAYTDERHMKCTGVSNRKILTNLTRLSNMGKRMWVRIPIIMNVNITVNEMERMAEFLESVYMERVELLPYHRLGIEKYSMCGLEYSLKDVKQTTDEMLDCFRRILREHNISAD